jgi:AAHS family 4-hydroxybenzoate transporter-like MFS transporter
MMNRLPRTVDVAALLNERKLSSFNVKLIILSWLITVFDGLDMMMVSFTAPYMRDEMGLSKPMLGYVFSAGTMGMVLGGLIFSNIGDRIGRRPTVVFCAFTFGLLTIATAFANSYESLLALRFLDGLAIGGMLPLAWALNIEFVPSRMRGTVVAVIMMGYTIGSASAAPLTNLIAPTHGWEGVYMFGGIGTLFCAAALFLFLPESVRFLVAKGMKPDQVVRTLKRVDPAFDVAPGDTFILGDEKKAVGGFRMSQLFEGDLSTITPLLWIAYAASSLAIYFGSSWGPLVLEELHIPRSTAAIVASIGGLCGATAGMILMRITDKHGPRSVALFPAIAVPVLLLLGLGYVPQALFLPIIVLQAILIGGEHSAVISISGSFYPSAIRASGGGWVASVGKMGGVAGPVIGGYILSSGLPILSSYAFLALCPLILCACILGISTVVRGRVVHDRPPLDVVPAS